MADLIQAGCTWCEWTYYKDGRRPSRQPSTKRYGRPLSGSLVQARFVCKARSERVLRGPPVHSLFHSQPHWDELTINPGN